MTNRVNVVLYADVAAVIDICGRPAIDWLLDTIELLEPRTASVTGPVADAVRDRLTARLPHLDHDTAGAVATVALRCSMPLVQPSTVRRALAGIADGARAAAVKATRDLPWWAESTGPSPVVVAAVAGPNAEATALAVLDGEDSDAVTMAAGPVESLSISDPSGIASVAQAVYQRISAGWVARGVIIEDPSSTRIDARARLEPGVRIRPNTDIQGDSTIGAGSRIGPTVTIRDARIGTDCQIRYAVCQDVEIGDRGNIGPFCWLRSGTRLGADGRAGAFVELADSVIGEGTSIPHLGGLFSADVGRNCNIAGMSAPANFNGITKNRVTIGDDVSIGAGNVLVAPISIGDGASTAAGSTITMDVPDGALGLARASQRNFAGWHESMEARRRAEN